MKRVLNACPLGATPYREGLALQERLVEARVAGRTGVWTEGEKIASIGIAVRRWVSYHGFALNHSPDLAAFDLIHPCGLRGIRMTSMAAKLGAKCPTAAAVRAEVAEVLATRLGFDAVSWEHRPRLDSNEDSTVDPGPLSGEHIAC